MVGAAAAVLANGWTQWTSLQPDDRFWHFQLVEGGVYLALSVLLALAAVRWVTRRAG